MRRFSLILFFLPLFVKAQIITTVAGNGTWSSTGDGGPATNASISPLSCAVDRQGNVYIAEATKIRMIDSSGTITTIAGTGVSGYSGDGGPATAAQFENVGKVVVDDAGNLFIVEGGGASSCRIRKIDATTKIITKIAGSSVPNCGLYIVGLIDGARADTSCLFITDLCLDRHGNLFFSSMYQIGKIDTAGIIRVIAPGRLSNPGALVVDTADNIYVGYEYAVMHGPTYSCIFKVSGGVINSYAGSGLGSLAGWSGDGGPATAAKVVAINSYFAIDRAGSFYFLNSSYIMGEGIRRVDTNSIICTVAGNGTSGFSGDGGLATAAQLYVVRGVAVDTSGTLYIADDTRIRKITTPACGYVSMVSVADVIQGAAISLHPNPVQNTLTISAGFKITEVAVFNLIGQTLSTHKHNKEEVQINVSNLPPGVYLVRINGTEVRRFVKE